MRKKQMLKKKQILEKKVDFLGSLIAEKSAMSEVAL